MPAALKIKVEIRTIPCISVLTGNSDASWPQTLCIAKMTDCFSQNVPHPERSDLHAPTSLIKIDSERAKLTAPPALGAYSYELLDTSVQDAKAQGE